MYKILYSFHYSDFSFIKRISQLLFNWQLATPLFVHPELNEISASFSIPLFVLPPPLAGRDFGILFNPAFRSSPASGGAGFRHPFQSRFSFFPRLWRGGISASFSIPLFVLPELSGISASFSIPLFVLPELSGISASCLN
jgi:hypothetical protein